MNKPSWDGSGVTELNKFFLFLLRVVFVPSV